jgi:TetR/AcrR family transcriptional regulator
MAQLFRAHLAKNVAKPATKGGARLGTRGQPEESRAAILKAAEKEFAEQGVAGARTDAIAKSAKVNKALIYYYFQNKNSLYGAVLDTAFAGLKAQVFTALDSDLSPRGKLVEYVSVYFDFLAAHPLYPRLMQREMMRARDGQSTIIDKIVKDSMRPIFGKVSAVLQEGIASGEFRKVDPAHFVPSMVAMIVFYFSSAPVIQRIVRFDPLAPERVAERKAAVLDFITTALFEPVPAKASARSRIQGERK